MMILSFSVVVAEKRRWQQQGYYWSMRSYNKCVVMYLSFSSYSSHSKVGVQLQSHIASEMYPLNTNANDSIPHSHDQSIHCRQPPFGFGDSDPNSKQEDPPSSSFFFNFPSPYIHYEDDAIFLQHLHDLLLQQQQPPLTPADHHHNTATAEADAMNNNTSADSNQTDADGLIAEYCNKKSNRAGAGAGEQTPRKRSSKKDRHSKIDTANGPRDRRMRLSLEVARKFFGLQDMLGFDKASKTVDWLMEKAKPAIKELATTLPHIKHMSCSTTVGAHSSSSTSECEMVSGILMDESSINKAHTVEKLSREKKLRAPRKSPIFHPLARESREKARARARERTREKWRLDESKVLNPGGISSDLNRLGSWSPFDNGEESGSQCHNMKLSYELVLPHEVDQEPSCHGLDHDLEAKHDMAGDSLVITGNWSPSILFNHHHNTGIPQEHQSTEVQFYGKPWEAYSTINLL